MTDTEQPKLVTYDELTEGFGAFDELEFLGGGTFGETFRTLRGDDEVVLKIIDMGGVPDHFLRREVEALQRVDHPNVVGFFGSGTVRVGTRDLFYLRCEYINGGDLKHAIEERRRPEAEDDVRAMLTGLLAGVAEIHDLGILHRDIKPANVALRDADWGQPVLLDFGLARVLDMSSHTEYPSQLGTSRYMSPEQLRGAPARRRSDLYAIGLVVYETVTGTHPFIPRGEATTLQSLHDRMRDTPPENPVALNEHCPPEVASVVLRLLSYRPHERLGTSAAFADLEGKDAAQ